MKYGSDGSLSCLGCDSICIRGGGYWFSGNCTFLNNGAMGVALFTLEASTNYIEKRIH